MEKAIAIIPARMGSTRFPGKVLASATGWPLIRHVVEGAWRAACVDRVVVATDDDGVRRAVEGFGGDCVVTASDHPNGTSRIAEACDQLGLTDGQVIVNIQGDEPEMDPAVVEAAVAALSSGAAPVATVAAPFGAGEDPSNPNIVKVVRRLDGTALYFSRSLIPFDRDNAGGARPLRHIGLYAYRRVFLRAYSGMAPTPLEECERLEQLRVLEHGHAIAVAVVSDAGAGRVGIDTPEQYAAFVKRWRGRE